MMSGDVVGWLVWGFSKKGALRLGLFLLRPPATSNKKVIWGKKKRVSRDAKKGLKTGCSG